MIRMDQYDYIRTAHRLYKRGIRQIQLLLVIFLVTRLTPFSNMDAACYFFMYDMLGIVLGTCRIGKKKAVTF